MLTGNDTGASWTAMQKSPTELAAQLGMATALRLGHMVQAALHVCAEKQ